MMMRYIPFWSFQI